MAIKSRWIELAVAAIPVFADDGTLDAAELERLVTLAMEDERVDADERRVMLRILSALDLASLPTGLAIRVRALRTALELETESAWVLPAAA